MVDRLKQVRNKEVASTKAFLVPILLTRKLVFFGGILTHEEGQF